MYQMQSWLDDYQIDIYAAIVRLLSGQTPQNPRRAHYAAVNYIKEQTTIWTALLPV